MRLIKRALLQLLRLPGADILLRPAMRARATIFLLHRFRDEALGVTGTDPATLRSSLAWMRRHRYPMIPLQELFERMAVGTVPSRAVSFTIDDGYLDQVTVAAPVFAEFDCPVTVFLTSGFIDGTLWFWWDRLEYVFEHSRGQVIELELGNNKVRYAWSNAEERERIRLELVEWCKQVPDAEKHAVIDRLAHEARVELPRKAPPRYAPMSWDQARSAESGGMTFGPHTVTHPILTQTPDRQAHHEISESWRRVSEEVSAPCPIFCYPNGGPADFGSREIVACRAAGLIGALVGPPGYADAGPCVTPEGLFRVPRFGMPEELPLVIQCVSGLERIKGMIRSGGER